MATRIPVHMHTMVQPSSNTWLKGRKLNDTSVLSSMMSLKRSMWASIAAFMLRCMSMTPLGTPVVPDV